MEEKKRRKDNLSFDSGKRGFLKGMTAAFGASLLAGLHGCKKADCPPVEPPECPPCELPESGKTAAAEPKQPPKAKQPGDIKPWIGKLDRSKVDWGPTVDAEKCIGCGLCMNCGRGVYEWIDNKAVVKQYGRCIPGCRTCANLCPEGAITFPDPKTLRELFKREKVYDNTRRWLEEIGKIPKA